MKVTIADIARKANVSKMTVSRVLSNKGNVAKETEERIRKIIDEHNFEPNFFARGLSSKRSMILGVIIFKTAPFIFDNYIAGILSGIVDNSDIQKYRIMLLPVDPHGEDKREYLRIARTNMLDGLILLRSRADDEKIDHLAESGFPFVLVNYKKNSPHYNFVDTENVKGGMKAVEYLINKGHRRIAFLSGNLLETNARDRLKGYTEALIKHDIPIREEWIIPTEFNEEDAYQKTGLLINGSERPTAIFCANDYMAIGAMKRLKEDHIRIPEDMAIVGFDDIELASYIKPKLTTVHQPLYDLGKNAGEILLDIITGKQKTPVHKLMSVELMERETC